MQQKKSYDLKLLIIGLIGIIFVISSHTLRNYYSIETSTSNSVFDIIFGLSIMLLMILQPKDGLKGLLILLLTYGTINFIGSLFSSSYNRYDYPIYQNQTYHVFSSLSSLLSNITFLIGTLFIAMHVFQPRFNLLTTKKLVGGLLGSSFIFALIPSILLTNDAVTSIITVIIFLISYGLISVGSVLMISDSPAKSVEEPGSELDKLLKNGLITDAEYAQRKEKIEQQSK